MTHRRRIAYAVAVVGPPLLAGALSPLRGSGLMAAAAIALVIPVLGAAVLGGRGPGVVGAILGAASFDYFLTAPFRSFRIAGTDDVAITTVLLLVGLVVAQLDSARDGADRRAADRSRDLDSLRRVAGLGAGGGDVGWLIRAARSELIELLGTEAIDFRPGPPPSHLLLLGHGKVTASGNVAGRTPEDACTLAIPVNAGGRHHGHFLVRYPTRVPAAVPTQQRAQAMAVAEMLGAAIGRAPRMSAN